LTLDNCFSCARRLVGPSIERQSRTSTCAAQRRIQAAESWARRDGTRRCRC
jgi:hypothetical protein